MKDMKNGGIYRTGETKDIQVSTKWNPGLDAGKKGGHS